MGGYVHRHSNVQMKVSPRARGGGLCTRAQQCSDEGQSKGTGWGLGARAQQCSDEGQSKGTGWGVMYTGTAMFR